MTWRGTRRGNNDEDVGEALALRGSRRAGFGGIWMNLEEMR